MMDDFIHAAKPEPDFMTRKPKAEELYDSLDADDVDLVHAETSAAIEFLCTCGGEVVIAKAPPAEADEGDPPTIWQVKWVESVEGFPRQHDGSGPTLPFALRWVLKKMFDLR